MEHIGILLTAILILVVFYLAQIPAKRQEKEIAKMQDNLKEKDHIITYTGLTGEIVEVLEDQVILKTQPEGVKLSIEKWAVAGLDERKIKEEK